MSDEGAATLASGGQPPDAGKRQQLEVAQVGVRPGTQKKRVLIACIPCKLGKRKCNDYERPCRSCLERGMDWQCIDEIKEVSSAALRRLLVCKRSRMPAHDRFQHLLLTGWVADTAGSDCMHALQQEEGQV